MVIQSSATAATGSAAGWVVGPMAVGIIVVVAVGVVALLIGCGPPRGARFISDPDPAVKIPAIRQAAKADDRASIPQLVKNLSSDDPAVRFYAITALRRLTDGQTFDYVYYAPEDQRRAAIDRWRAWLEQQSQGQATN
jgi:hypothetical protein